MTKQRYIRILIGDLTKACVSLGECHVVAAGSMYATLWCKDWEVVAETLTKHNISWSFD